MKGNHFRRSFRGYERHEVDEFVKVRDEQMCKLRLEIGRLRDDLDRALKSLASQISGHLDGKETARIMGNVEGIIEAAEERAARKISMADEAAAKIGRAVEGARREEERVRELRNSLLNDLRDFLTSFAGMLDSRELESGEAKGGLPEFAFGRKTGTDG